MRVAKGGVETWRTGDAALLMQNNADHRTGSAGVQLRNSSVAPIGILFLRHAMRTGTGHGSGIHIHACQYCKPLIPTIRTGPRRLDRNANNVPSRQLAVRVAFEGRQQPPIRLAVFARLCHRYPAFETRCLPP
ncbi:hypothetical protein L1887_53566 [Cichorium endivia]|nr:hypothetical protein L1887_53566 [Cichorium endivia]